MLTQRMAKNANTMLAGDVVDPEVAFLLGKDTNTFRDTLQALLNGNEAHAHRQVTRRRACAPSSSSSRPASSSTRRR